jgi:uncharacterized protein
MEPLGFGLGLRPIHYPEILAGPANVDWFEALTENYLVGGGAPLYHLDAIAERYPLCLHGVSLSIGSIDPIDHDYIDRVRSLARRCKARWVSDHLCWTGIDGLNLHDLLPLPMTEETLHHVTTRINEVQDHLEQPLVLENVSSYIAFRDEPFTEWEFLTALCERTGCRLLLDLNNVYVTSQNRGFAPQDFLDGIPLKAVQQFHLAGHSHANGRLIDTHDHPVSPEVWALYAEAVARFGPISVALERDDAIPPYAELCRELELARQIVSATPGEGT